MNTYFSIFLVALLPVGASVLLSRLYRNSQLQNLSYAKKQILAGLVFGMLAICGTELGIPFQGTIINARDAAPICAGLIFGAPAGIIAGVIGGIERWFAVYWGIGYYTRVGCTISTIFAGVLSAALKKYMFDDRIPGWRHTAVISAITEVVHMLMIFITNVGDIRQAFTYVRVCSAPMIIANACSAALAVYLVRKMNQDQEQRTGTSQKPTIFEIFQSRIVLVVLGAYLLTFAVIYVLQNQIAKENTAQLFFQNIHDLITDVSAKCDENLIQTAKHIAASIQVDADIDLNEIRNQYDVYEINVAGSDGIIINSSQEYHRGKSLRSYTGGNDIFLEMLTDNGPEETITELSPLYSNSGQLVSYAAVKTDTGVVQVIYTEEQVNDMIRSILPWTVYNRHIGSDGGLICTDHDGNVIDATSNLIFDMIENTERDVQINYKETVSYEIRRGTIDGVLYYYSMLDQGVYKVFCLQPANDADFSKRLSIYLNLFLISIIFGMLFAMISMIIKYGVVRNIEKVNESLSLITDGNLDTVVDVRSSVEFNDLSDDINSTVDTLKRYIAEANARIDTELQYAREIQRSALPSVFPETEEAEIYALMNPAKEVGGDFYDFYFLGTSRLVFLVADVSGKGIPASLFMMRAKTLLKTYAENRTSVEKTFTIVNNQLCEGNDAGMFVTAWMGILDLHTGVVRYANAGHNHPLIRRKDGTFEFIKERPGFVLAGMENIVYRQQTFTLEPGDEIFLYTDGVVEATDRNGQLYGDARLKECLDSHIGEDAKTLCTSVREDINEFYNGAPVYDDITELSLKFLKYKEK